MREIKFRGVALDGEPVYGDLAQDLKNGMYFIADRRVDYWSIRQLAGFDFDGNELYEGDVVTDRFGEEFTVSLDAVVNGEDVRLMDDDTYKYTKK